MCLVDKGWIVRAILGSQFDYIWINCDQEMEGPTYDPDLELKDSNTYDPERGIVIMLIKVI